MFTSQIVFPWYKSPLYGTTPNKTYVRAASAWSPPRVAPTQAIANRYMPELPERIALDYGILSKWVSVNAVERTYHGSESEKKALKASGDKYIEA